MISLNSKRGLTLKEDEELAELNAAVERALLARREWLDKKIYEVSKLQPGDDLYDLDTGCKVGVVESLYRLHSNQNPLYDTSVSFDIKYEVSPMCFDNTSRQIGKRFGTKAEYIEKLEAKLKSSKG